MSDLRRGAVVALGVVLTVETVRIAVASAFGHGACSTDLGFSSAWWTALLLSSHVRWPKSGISIALLLAAAVTVIGGTMGFEPLKSSYSPPPGQAEFPFVVTRVSLQYGLPIAIGGLVAFVRGWEGWRAAGPQ